MKLTCRFLRRSTVAACAALATTAFADTVAQPASYVGLHGGINNVSDWSATVNLGSGVTVPGTVSTGRGTHFGIFGGRQTEHARFELEYQAGNFDIDAIELGPVRQALSDGGNYRALTINAYRTAALNEQVTAFAGLGLGWGSVSLPQMSFVNPPCKCFASASATGFAWLGRLGLEYRFGDASHAFVQYTWLGLPRPGSGGTPGVEYERKTIGSVSLGYRHTF